MNTFTLVMWSCCWLSGGGVWEFWHCNRCQ